MSSMMEKLSTKGSAGREESTMKRTVIAMLIIIAAASLALPLQGLCLSPSGLGGVLVYLPQAILPIVFVSNRDGNSEIYRMNSDGSAVRRLTFKVDAVDREPRISPDSSRIAFATNRDGNSEIYVMNADGSSQSRLTNNPGEDNRPSWSPDGSRIVFERVSSVGGRYVFHLLIMNSDGTGERIIATDGTNPVWSPDGRRIAFLAFESFPGGLTTTQIYSMNVDGSGRRRLTVSRSTDSNPDWSPDGSQIVFMRDFDIWVMRADGSAQRRICPGRHPAWSRDGRSIVFVRGRDDSTQIYTMNPDGTSQTRISASAGWNYNPDW
jgi:Tol biopolymer transport system component